MRGASTRSALLAVLLVASVGGCGNGTAREGRPDAEGDTAPEASPRAAATDRGDFDGSGEGSPPLRVVSLVPSATEILVALGAADRLVGRTDFDTDSTVRSLPSVGGGLHPSLEALTALEPDLVIRFGGETDTATPGHLDRLGVEHVAVRPDRLADVLDIIVVLGELVGRTEAARELRQRIEADLEAVRRRVADEERVRVAYLVGGRPPLVAGPGTFIDDLIRVAGGVNVFDDLDRLYAPVSEEELLARPLDVVLVSEGAGSVPDLPAGALLQEVSADVEIPGIHLASAAEQLARTLHPATFP